MVELLVGSELGRIVEGTDDVVTGDLARQSAQRQVTVMQIAHGRHETDFAPYGAPLFYFFADLRDAGGNLHIRSILSESQ